MKTYTIRMRTATACLDYSYETKFASDEMAIDYARRHFEHMEPVRWLYGLDVFNEEEHIAYIKHAPLQTIVGRD